jgi:hypothetical protein
MFNRNKRVLWLLNHKTLMPYEVPLLINLGYEVFTPKVIPTTAGFRSGAVDFSYDPSLTVPESTLARLNEFNFYDAEWPADIVALVNRYFGTVYIMPYGKQIEEAVKKFEGQILFRAFGLDGSRTYKSVLSALYGREIFDHIGRVRGRFWFAQGYEQLVECEPPFLADRSISLPIGVPDAFWVTANSYTGVDKRILFVCPNCITNPYYADIYKKFKADLGDLPHVIVGAQDVPVDDKNVLGYVSDEELARLYSDCAVLYYHSTELRHVHYSPIEAAINGMPVVYYADSLLGRMTPEISYGRSVSFKEARASIERILSGDAQYLRDLRTDQRALAHQFSDEYCRARWKENFSSSGYGAATQPENPIAILWREAKRVILSPISLGLSSLPSGPPAALAPTCLGEEEIAVRSFIDEGIDFTNPDFPPFVRDVAGISFPEIGGRWSVGPAVTISLTEDLPRRFRLTLEGGAYGPNIGASAQIKIGNDLQTFTFRRDPGQGERVVLEFKTRRPSTKIKIKVPCPSFPLNDNRQIGLALTKMAVELIED